MRFPQDYDREELAKLVIWHRDATIEAETKLSELRDRFIKVSKELSLLKKQNR